jgi:hypothetical protein
LKNKILLTFDLEEFDLPLEYGCPLREEDQINISNEGLIQLTRVLSKFEIPATFFTTSYFAGRNVDLIKDLSLNHEIASHSKFHSQFEEDDLFASRTELENITGKRVYGFRMPKFKKTEFSLIKEAGYIYDSSVNPTCIPGRYNYFFNRKTLYHDSRSSVIEIPLSVTPIIRFPLFWLSFKNLPPVVYLNLCKEVLFTESYLHIVFHPWEFAEICSFKIPWYVKNPSGKQLLSRFEKLLVGLRKKGEFSTISDFLNIDKLD